MSVDADPDAWLARWSRLLIERAGAGPVLELGCGSGRDSEQLAALGLRVVGLDLSAESIARASERVPGSSFDCHDLRDPFPAAAALGAVVASLCLHYFPWAETVALSARGTDGRAENAAALIERYDSVAFVDKHRPALPHEHQVAMPKLVSLLAPDGLLLMTNREAGTRWSHLAFRRTPDR